MRISPLLLFATHRGRSFEFARAATKMECFPLKKYSCEKLKRQTLVILGTEYNDGPELCLLRDAELIRCFLKIRRLSNYYLSHTTVPILFFSYFVKAAGPLHLSLEGCRLIVFVLTYLSKCFWWTAYIFPAPAHHSAIFGAPRQTYC